MRYTKEHKRILTAMHNGLKLEPMKSTGNCLEDGFVLGFSEVLSSAVIFLQNEKLIDVSQKTGDYFITKKGMAKIGIGKAQTSNKKIKEGM